LKCFRRIHKWQGVDWDGKIYFPGDFTDDEQVYELISVIGEYRELYAVCVGKTDKRIHTINVDELREVTKLEQALK
jgi:hypothetical protein